MAKTKPLIRFELPDADVVVKCSNGHDQFSLIVRMRLAGSLVTRHAKCVVCAEEQPLD
jgi:hypothetical protein